MGQSAGRLPRKTHAGSMPSVNGVSVWFLASSGITSSPVMKFDARPTNLYLRKLSNHAQIGFDKGNPYQTLFEHIARMDDNVDAKQILTFSPSVYWKRPLGRLRMTWMKTVQNDLDAHRLSRTDAVDLAQNRPLWRLLATNGAKHS